MENEQIKLFDESYFNTPDLEPYPITKAFEGELEMLLDRTETIKMFTIRAVAKRAKELVGEYEHGTAEVEDVYPGLNLKAYKETLMDFMLYLQFGE